MQRFSSRRGQISRKASPINVTWLLSIVILIICYLDLTVLQQYNEKFEMQSELAKSKSDFVPGSNVVTKEKASTEVIVSPPAEKEGGLPSAKSLLTQKPPFEDSDIIKIYPDDAKEKPLIKSENTIVTGYFRLKSKHSSEKYDRWMRNMLSVQDAMVIFTDLDMVEKIKDFRSHALDRTVIVPLSLKDLPIGNLYPESFWKDQLERDPEKKIHKSHQLFWIWLSKSWCLAQAIRMNIFDSDVFVWSDIGCFRDRKFNGKTVVAHREVIPRNEILQMAHHKPNPPSEELFNDKYKKKANFYHSGSQFVGYKDTVLKFHEYFLETIDRFLEKNMIIVEDQAILQSVCLSHPDICAYAPFTEVKDNHYFGLRHVLHHGDKINYWRFEGFKK